MPLLEDSTARSRSRRASPASWRGGGFGLAGAAAYRQGQGQQGGDVPQQLVFLRRKQGAGGGIDAQPAQGLAPGFQGQGQGAGKGGKLGEPIQVLPV